MAYGDPNPQPAPQYAHDAAANANPGEIEGATPSQIEGIGVEIPSKRYDKGKAKRDLPRTLMGGTDAMAAAGTKYMPQHQAEDGDTYASRLYSTVCYGGFRDTVIEQSAKFFTEQVDVEEVPEPLRTLTDNIDGQGRAITPFAMDLVKEAFVDGISFILVDHEPVVYGMTQADVQTQGIRPYWVLIKADDLIGWVTGVVNGTFQVIQVRIKECVEVPDGEFGTRDSVRIRVIEQSQWRVYEYKQHDVTHEYGYFLVQSGTNNYGFVPIVPFYTNRTAFMEAEPPLQSLADLNKEHWISSSEQRRALTFQRFAMLCIVGSATDGSTVVVGPDKLITLQEGGSATYVDPPGAGIGAGQADLDAIEKRMGSVGMTLRVENAGDVTATASAIDEDDSTATLKAIAKGLKDTLEIALGYTAIMSTAPNGGKVGVFDDFANSVAPGTITEINALVVSGTLSKKTGWVELKRRDMLSEDFDPNVEEENLQKDMDAYMGMQQQQQDIINPEAGPSSNLEPVEKTEKTEPAAA